MVIGRNTAHDAAYAVHVRCDVRLRLMLACGLACVLALLFGSGAAYADTGNSEDAESSAALTESSAPLKFKDEFVTLENTVFVQALEQLDNLCEISRLDKERDEVRYIQEMMAERAERDARWKQVQEWRYRFPEGDYSDVLFIGDSIMDESRYLIMDAMPGSEVNADSGRTLEEGGLIREDAAPDCGVLDHIRNDDGSHVRYVIGTGNNDGGGVPLYVGEEIVERLGPDKEIYFVTEMVTANPGGMATTNGTIDALVEAYPNVHKIDWSGYVEKHGYGLLRDWCHPAEYAKPEYVGVLKDGLDVCYAR